MRPPFAHPTRVTASARAPHSLHPGDARRAIPRHVWLRNRARNALQRPAFIGAISVATFVTALVSMIVAPRAQRRSTPVVASVPRPDTLSLIAAEAVARTRIVQADSLLAAARSVLASQTLPPVADSAAAVDSAYRDSIQTRIAALNRNLARAEQAPLPSSYRTLAGLPELRGDPRVRALVDSLRDIERERDAFGAVGGVDPIFVALTSRASEIGRRLQAIAVSVRDSLSARAGDAPPAAAVVAATPSVDTMPFVQQRDSARVALRLADDSLARRRELARALDLEEERARERASAVAPPLALLASAFVLSAVIGFATALFGELRRPRVSDGGELERLLGVRVLSVVEASMPSTERGRRQADRAAPPYFDPGAEAYQLAYLGLATEHPTLLSASVTGDEPATAALVACNLAAVAVDEARTTLVIDLDPSCMGAAALRSRAEPGVADLARGVVTWPDATISASVGRDKFVDLVPFGVSDAPAPDAIRDLMRRDAARLSRYYDAVITILSPAQARSDLIGALPSPEVVYCARPGITGLEWLSAQLDAIREAGGHVRGVVLWSAERPLLPTPRQASSSSRRQRAARDEPALARA